MIKKISLPRDSVRLKQDLDRYVKLALEHGATAAAIVPTGQIIVDERVRMKCRFPLCAQYGTSMNCPPYTGGIEEMQKRVKLYQFAIVCKLDTPGAHLVSQGANSKGAESQKGLKDLRLLCKIVSTVESAAFYDGYYLAAGFTSASCKLIWCKDVPCQALLEGMGCRFQARAYASMEAVGIDVYRLATSLGWDIYPIGSAATAETIPCGSRYGLILID